ncbi:acetate kinase [Morchella snyderi]|nr:acetate kinase [Morchella snyderi]
MSTAKLILAINAGSSSVKLSLYSSTPPEAERKTGNTPCLILQSSISNLTSPPAVFSYTHTDNSSTSSNVKSKELPDVKSQDDAFKHFLEYLSKDSDLKQVNSGEDITFACHRIVHGGDYERPVVINEESLNYLKELSDLAPLHNSPALSLVHTTLKQLPKTTNIAYFDTSFHTLSMPEHIKTYPVDLEHARRNKIRKYGFHGISYSFIVTEVAEYLKKPVEETSIIALHLGSGASVCAIRNGKSLDNSMGLTPLEGLPGATRSGTVDPSLVFHYTSNAGRISHSGTGDMHISKAEEILNKKSGWSSIIGTTDFSKLKSDSPPPHSELVFDLFVDRIHNYIGAYFVKLRGRVDALVFAGGIGEKSSELREAVVDGVQCLGFSLNKKSNESIEKENGIVLDIGDESARAPKVLICSTDEQFEMARECAGDKEFWSKL